MNTITITNQKGGVGKTATAQIIATGLADRGFRVLAVDADPQTNLSYSVGLTPDKVSADLYDVFTGADSSLQAIQPTAAGFDALAGSLKLAGADMEFTQAGREYRLREALEPVKEMYDFCIIDTPPSLGILTINALTASDGVIIPMNSDIYSIQGLIQLQGIITNVRKYCNPALKVDGLLLTRYNPRAVINRNMRDALAPVAAQLQTIVYNAVIREAIAVREVQYTQGNLFKDYPKANVTKDYSDFLTEFLAQHDL